ncbi:MAG TPA: hypothetical protein VEL05_08495, partial [Candidatus Acidoferrum sp.]|nr:hypothetical protein [Candidatus Acidoferrum sp.]
VLAAARAERERLAGSAARKPTGREARETRSIAPDRAPPTVDGRSSQRGGARLLLVGRTGGHLVQPGLAADPAVTTRAADLVHRMGGRARVIELRGIASPGAVKAALDGSGAAFALLSEIQELRFSWLGVLTARGRVRLVLVDVGGSAVFDSTVQTDTLVGSRGDRHEALLGFVARQALDIAAPRLRRILAR